MFGLYEGEDSQDGRKRIEKRVLRFSAPDYADGAWKDVPDAFDPASNLEIRVHRASGRKRVGWETEKYLETPHGLNPRGIEWVEMSNNRQKHTDAESGFPMLDAQAENTQNDTTSTLL